MTYKATIHEHFHHYAIVPTFLSHPSISIIEHCSYAADCSPYRILQNCRVIILHGHGMQRGITLGR